MASTNYIFSNHQQNCFLVETNCESHRRSTYQRHHPDKKKRYISTQTLFTLYRNFSHKTMFQAILLYSTPKNESITAKSERHKHTIPPLHRINAKFWQKQEKEKESRKYTHDFLTQIRLHLYSHASCHYKRKKPG